LDIVCFFSFLSSFHSFLLSSSIYFFFTSDTFFMRLLPDKSFPFGDASPLCEEEFDGVIIFFFFKKKYGAFVGVYET